MARSVCNFMKFGPLHNKLLILLSSDMWYFIFR